MKKRTFRPCHPPPGQGRDHDHPKVGLALAPPTNTKSVVQYWQKRHQPRDLVGNIQC